jgi:hypothetical protein
MKGFVFKSSDLGNTWTNTSIPSCAWVHDFVEYHTGTIYAGTDQGLFKYDGSWQSAGLPLPVNTLIQTSDSVLYAGTWDGEIHKSGDGTSWSQVTVNNAERIWDLIEVNDTLYAGGTRTGTMSGVFKSVDGITFDTTCFPHKDKVVYALLVAQDSKIYAGTGPDSGKVFKTSDGGNTWDTTQTLQYANSIQSLLQADYGTICAAGRGGFSGYFYRSNNGGQTWSFELISTTVNNVYSLFQAHNAFLFAGTNKGAGSNTAVWKAGYHATGQLKSSSYHADPGDVVNYGSVSWDADLNSGDVEVWIRTNTAPDMYGTDSFQVMQSGDTIPNAFDNKGYIHYQIKLSSPTADSTPIFNYVKIYYTPYIGVQETLCTSHPSLSCIPNPVSCATTITYVIPRSSENDVSTIGLGVYDSSGRLVKKLVDSEKPPGHYNVDWNTGELPSGLYFAKLTVSDHYASTQKVIFLK